MYLHNTFHMPSFSDSVVIFIKPKDKCRFRVAAILLFYIVQEISLLWKLNFFRKAITAQNVAEIQKSM
jgi:uncharacterized membrane protein YqjE